LERHFVLWIIQFVRKFAVFLSKPSGVECEIGKVLVWDPPSRIVLGWQLTADWKFDPDLITEVEVRFIPESANTTRVELEHRNLERFGDRADAWHLE
jgi:uncharacterized protein YndB with AHSA1/START domain